MSVYKRNYKKTSKSTISAAKSVPLLTLSEAKKKLMDFVARRDHTEKELIKKLSRYCDIETVHKTIDWATKQNWLANPEKLRIQFTAQLERRGKGIRKINQKLKELGLSSIKPNQTLELQKAKKLVLTKWSANCFEGLEYKELQKLRARISRYLISRGYESDIINIILKNEFKKSSSHPLKDTFDDSDYTGENRHDDEF